MIIAIVSAITRMSTITEITLAVAITPSRLAGELECMNCSGLLSTLSSDEGADVFQIVGHVQDHIECHCISHSSCCQHCFILGQCSIEHAAKMIVGHINS